VLRRIFGSKKDEIAGYWRKLHNKELKNLYSSTNTIEKIKKMRMKWAGPVTRMGRTGMHKTFWWETQNERDRYIYDLRM
jgi:hypothetical protein